MRLFLSNVFCLALGMVFLSSAPAAWAQVTTATLSGIVKDQTGAIIPGAEVMLIHEGTAAERRGLTGETGDFLFNLLPVGRYTVRIGMPGFKALVNRGLELSAGQNVRETFVLQVGEVADSVTVEAATPLVNTVSTEQRENIDRLKLTELPLARRNLTSILRLSTGVDISDHTRSLRINGIGKSGTGFSIDGTDASSNPEGRGISQYQGVGNYIDGTSIEAVQEIQLMRGILAAEYGGAVGGQVNIISKSGTNALHGSLVYNYQSHIFDARHPFLPSRAADGTKIPKPRVVFNQFGGSVGGPIIRERAFFFATYEGYRETRFGTQGGTVPTQKLRDEILQASPFPETRRILDFLPLPNVPRDENLGRFESARNREARENLWVLRGDVLVARGSNLAVSYTRSRPWSLEPSFYHKGVNDRIRTSDQDRLSFNFTTGRGDWSSESRFGWTFNEMQRIDEFFQKTDPTRPEKRRWGRIVPTFSISGLFSGPDGEWWLMEGSTYTVDQKIARHAGRHFLKFGGSFRWVTGSRNNPENPTFEYANLNAFLANDVRGIVPTFGAPPYTSRMYDFGFFIQDDWRVSPRLVLNLGFRYDFYSNMVAKPSTSDPAGFFNLTPPTDWRKFDFGPTMDPNRPYDHDKVNLGPRFGFAYDLHGQSKTVIRGGFGVLFNPLMPGMVRQAVASPVVPFRVRFGRQEARDLALKWPMYPEEIRDVVENFTKTTGQRYVFSVMNPHIENPYAMHYQLNVQRAFGRDLMWEVGYVGNRGVKFPLHRWFNLPDRQTGIRPNPLVIPGGYYVDQSQNSVYNALQTSLRRRFARNLSFDVHYTWGKGLAINGGDVGAYYQGDAPDRVQEFFNPRADRGPAIGDATHRFIADGIYQLPYLAGFKNPIMRHALGGWQVAGILSMRSGEPVIITQSCGVNRHCRPDFLGGEAVIKNWKQNEITQGCRPGAHCPRGYLNTQAFALVPLAPTSGTTIRPGSVGTSLVRGLGTWSTDLSLAKNFHVREEMNLQFRLDAFNALNHVNYGSPDSSINSVFFGQIRGIATGMRSMQMGLRLTF